MTASGVQLSFVDSLEEAENLLRWLGERREWLGVDTETGGFDWWRDPLRTVQLGDAGHGWCIPTTVRGFGWLADRALRDYRGRVAMHNCKFDTLFLERNGFALNRGLVNDTRVMGHLLDPRPGFSGLKRMADRYLGGGGGAQSDLKEVMARNGWRLTSVPVELPQFWTYAALDPTLTARLAELLWPRVAPYRRVYDVEVATAMVLADMERRGIRIDEDLTRQRRAEYDAEIHRLRTEARDEYGVDNPAANRQIYSRLVADGVQFVKMTPTGKPALTEDVLLGLTHPLAGLVLRLRHLMKMRASYFDSFLDLAESTPQGALLHCSTNPLAARTARMSITRPGLQTLPRGREVRDVFVPRRGNRLVLADYQNIEMRLLADVAQDAHMIEAFLAGADLHTYAAQRAYGVDEPSRDQRQTAKSAGFAKAFGAGVAKFALTAGLSLDEGQAFMDAYDREFPGVRELQTRIIETVERRVREEGGGYILTPLGRRLPIESDKAYKAINYRIQGTAADVFKETLVRLDHLGLTEHLVLPVHDELVFDVPEADVADLKHELTQHMTVWDGFAVPLTIEVEDYPSWGEKYAETPSAPVVGDEEEA